MNNDPGNLPPRAQAAVSTCCRRRREKQTLTHLSRPPDARCAIRDPIDEQM